MDETQWLPKGIAFITPERKAMLGITVEYDTEGLVKYARANQRSNILQYLHRQHILDDLEYDNGRDYQMWREIFRAFCGNQRMTASYDQQPKGNQSGSGIREQCYTRVLRMLPAHYQRCIEYSLDTAVTPPLERQARKHQELYQRVYNRLGAVMEMVREEVYESL